MLADVAPYLRCPLCGADLELGEGVLGCAQGHRFDVARQGYVSLLPGDARTGTADTATMVAARAEFLATGEYAALTQAVADAVASAVAPGCVVDAGGGTGHHLAAALDRCAERFGISCDLSRHAARRAARAHPRMGAVVADVWRGLPVRDAAATAVLNVFSPRNAEEFCRALHPDGVLVVAVPRPDHLAPLVRQLGLLTVDHEKPRRLNQTLGDRFTPLETREVRWTMRLSHAQTRLLVGMGPNAWHHADAGVASLPEPVEVTGAVDVATYRPRTWVS